MQGKRGELHLAESIQNAEGPCRLGSFAGNPSP